MNLSKEDTLKLIEQGKKYNLTGKQVIDGLIMRGYQPEGVNIKAIKQGQVTKAPTETMRQDLKGDFMGIGEDILESSQERAENITDIRNKVASGEKSRIAGSFQTAGQLAGAGADAIGSAFIGGAKMLLSPKSEEKVKGLITQFGQKVMENPQVQGMVKWYDSLPEETKDNIDAVGGFTSLASEFIGVGLAKRGGQVVSKGVQSGVKAVGEGVDTIGKTIGDSSMVSGLKQGATDIAERFPRALERGKENLAERAIKAEKIKTAAPSVKQAYKTNLDEVIIDSVMGADDATKKAFKEVVDIAEQPKTIGKGKQPSIVGGDLASKQYDIISSQKKKIGEQIGEITKNLSKTEKVNMQDGFRQMDDLLSGQGIIPRYTQKGVKLDFTGSKYTPAERTKIQQLYDLATEGGDTLSPSQIKSKDQLFSKLKRESNFEGVGDIIIETPDGNKSLFNVFRDIYSSKLDTISPEIRDLNSQYRKLANITDDIEDSIFKTPNFNVTKSVDPAEFAKVNMRRIFGEAGSSPAFEAVANNMDTLARELGYNGATPKQVAEFAEYIRKLYPESVPKTGFQGGIKAGLVDVIESVSKAGAPNLKDQREALKGLFGDYLQSSKKTTNPKTTPKTPTSADSSQIIKPTISNKAKKSISPNSTTKGLKAQGEILETNLIKEAKKYKSAEPITSVNPTGGILVDYTPQARMIAPLGENMTTLANSMKKNPDTLITVYRGAPKIQKDINPGDFISTDRNSALSYAENGNVISKKVRLGDILDDMDEPLGGDYLYRPGAFEEIGTKVRDITKSEWYNNYLNYLKENPTKFKNLDEWLNGMKASGKTKSQLEDIWNKANKK